MSVIESQTPTKHRYSPGELLTLPNGKDYELVDGELVERRMGWDSGWVAAQLIYLLNAHCRRTSPHWINGPDAGYQCFPDDPGKVRKPDVSLVRLERMSPEQKPQGHCRIAPDLAVEVISPNDFYSEVVEKVAEYLSAKVRLVWVIDPATKSARVHRWDGTVTEVKAAETLDGEDVLPGFRCPLNELFRPPGAVGTGQTQSE